MIFFTSAGIPFIPRQVLFTRSRFIVVYRLCTRSKHQCSLAVYFFGTTANGSFNEDFVNAVKRHQDQVEANAAFLYPP